MPRFRLNQTRKYEKKLFERIASKQSQQFLLGRLQKEWEELEEGVRREKRKQEIVRLLKTGGRAAGLVILTIAALAGVALIATVAPNLFAAVGRRGGYRKFVEKKGLGRELSYLEGRGYIARKNSKNKTEGIMEEIKLTDRGKQKVLQRVFSGLKISPQEKWDGIWRVVIFDIPNRHKHARDSLRERLKTMGLYALQKSVFVFPYPCSEEIEFLVYIYNLSDHVRFIETNKLSYDVDLKKHFLLR